MKKVLPKLIGIVLTVIICMQNTMLYALTEKQELENEKAKINEQIEEAEEKQKQLEKQKSQTMKEVEKLINQISNSEDEINEIESQISNLKNEIKSKETDIQQKQDEYIEQEKLLDTRLIAMYKNGNMSYLDALLDSSDMSDFLARYYSATELIECDKQLIQSTKEQKAQIEAEKEELENNKKELDSSLAREEQKSKELEGLRNEKETQAKKLTDEEKAVQKEIEELEAENKKIANQIKQAEIRYKKQLEALKNNSSSNSNSAGSGFFMRPVATGSITATAYYSSGKFHGGVDYGVSVGTKVVAAADGVVMLTDNLTGSYGTYVIIRHANGLQSYYAHGTKGSIVVSQGETVKKGQKIMLSGNTGRSSGPHLHFEVRKSPYNYSYNAKAYGQDSRVNPLNYM